MNTQTLLVIAVLAGAGILAWQKGWLGGKAPAAGTGNTGYNTQPISPTPVDTHATNNDVYNNIVTQAGSAVGDLINGIFGK